jgi:hypothetical protein
MAQKGGSIWAGYLTPYDKFVYGVTVGQKYLMENTTLGIPALIQSEGTIVMPHPALTTPHIVSPFPIQVSTALQTKERSSPPPSASLHLSTQPSSPKFPVS